jgi:hypothetical protein
LATKSKVLKLGNNSFGSELLIYVKLIVKKNWAQTLRSGFSIGGVPHKKYAVGNRVKFFFFTFGTIGSSFFVLTVFLYPDGPDRY